MQDLKDIEASTVSGYMRLIFIICMRIQCIYKSKHRNRSAENAKEKRKYSTHSIETARLDGVEDTEFEYTTIYVS